jgi:hypothetical protein
MIEKSKSSHLIACALIGLLLAVAQTFYTRILPITYIKTEDTACTARGGIGCGKQPYNVCLEAIDPGFSRYQCNDLAINGKYIGFPFAVPKDTERVAYENRDIKLLANFVISFSLPFAAYFIFLALKDVNKNQKQHKRTKK